MKADVDVSPVVEAKIDIEVEAEAELDVGVRGRRTVRFLSRGRP